MPNDMTMVFGDARRGLPDCRPKPECDPRPVCPACGGLECLCRPRFFAGQLLTEEDLNRLDHYIVAKNRLHNRHLFGSGVVCGLEVVCTTCDPAGSTGVVVKPGYALSPCGNDIVVCKPETVNVCELIERCRPRADDCYQPGDPDPAMPVRGHIVPSSAADYLGVLRGQEQKPEDWVLAICYQEKPSRGITAMRGASCGCGGSSSGDCGCGGGGHASSSASAGSGAYGTEASYGCGGGSKGKPAKTKSAAKAGLRPPQCEPTLTCEGYTFAVYKVPPAATDLRRGAVDPGALIKRFICCLQPLFEQLTTLPGDDATPKELHDALLNFIETIREFLITEGLYDCDLTARLSAVSVPAPRLHISKLQYANQWKAAALTVIEILVAVFQKCMCSALLPPCPPAEMNDCVPIATLSVARGRCRVRDICNIGNRRFLVTGPAIDYWLSWLPLLSSWKPGQITLRTLIEKICCFPVSQMFDSANLSLLKNAAAEEEENSIAGTDGTIGVPPGGFGVRAPGKKKAAIHPFTELLAESLMGAPEANAATVMLAAMGARAADGSPLVSETALEHPGQAMLIHQIVGPALAPLLPLVAGLAGGGAADRRTSSVDVKSLERSIASLKKQVKKHQTEITKLRKG